jgi:3-oxoadipate enol-lactonase
VTSDHPTLHVVEHGDGTPLVLLGSLGSTTAMWQPQFDGLADRFRCLAIDLPGHGASPTAAGGDSVTIASLADGVIDVLDRLGLHRVAVAGLSIGGMMALQLAAAHPERLTGVVALCTSAHLPSVESWRERATLVRTATNGAEAIAPTIVGRWFTPAFAAAHPDDVAAMEAMIGSVDPEGYARCCEAIGAMDLRPSLPTIDVPLLVIAGDADPSTPPDHGRAIATAAPLARFAVVPAAHLASWERSDDVNRLIAGFLEEGQT